MQAENIAVLQELMLKQDNSNLKVHLLINSTQSKNDVHFQIVDIAGKGKGVVVANKSIKKGEFVCKYIGELISYEKALEREKKYLKLQRVYKGYMFFFKFKDENLW